MSLLAQRAQPRVKYPADVRLFAGARGGAPVQGRSRNLGPTGIFVESGERLAIGSPVVCEIAFPSGPLRLSGLVAREQELPRETGRVGLGIRFVNLDQAARAVLEGLIPPDSRVGQLMSLHFEGLKEALRGQAAVTQHGGVGDVSVVTTLPFLREGNPVKVAFLSGASQVESRGQLRDVRMAEPGDDGSPRLELQLQFGHEGHDEREEVTEVTAVETPTGIKTGTVEEILARDRALTQRLRRGSRTKRGVAPMPPGPARAARTAAVVAGCLFLMAIGAAVNRFGLQWNSRHQGSGSVAVTTGRPGSPASGPPPIAAGASAPGATPPAAFHPHPATPPIAVEMIPHHPEIAPPSALPGAPPTAAAAAAPARAPGKVMDVAPPGVEPSMPPEAASSPAAAAAAGIPTLPAGTPGPEVVSSNEEIVATVPLSGSTAGAVQYPLTMPHGLAIDLPQAESVLPLGRHAIFNDGFRFISIRRREGGGLRLAFTYAYYTPRLLGVTIDETSVRVRVAPVRGAGR